MAKGSEVLSINPPSRADDWCRLWGEVVNKKTACVMLGIGYWKLYRMIEAGDVKQAPDGRVITRSAAEYAEKGIPQRKKRQK